MLAKIGTIIADYILKKIQSWLIAMVKLFIKEKKQDKEAEKAAEEYQNVVNVPTKSREERRRAEDSFLNS